MMDAATARYNFADARSMSGLIDAAFVQSPDESVFHIYEEDDDLKRKVKNQEPGDVLVGSGVTARHSAVGEQDDSDFGDSATEFGDFSVSTAPRNLSLLVKQFTKVIEAEERFVQLYKQNYRSDPTRIRKELSDKGFQFRKAKMVTMLSSRALRDAVVDGAANSGLDDSTNDELSVVMSVCTNYTSQTGVSDTDATALTAARLMERLKDPSDHDSVVSKELRQLTPEELAKRYVELQEKLARKQRKKEKKEKKEKKKKKKSKKKKKKEAEEAREAETLQGESGSSQPKSILKTSSKFSGSGIGGSTTTPPKSILRKTEDYFEEYQEKPKTRFNFDPPNDLSDQEPKREGSRSPARIRPASNKMPPVTTGSTQVSETPKKSLWKKLFKKDTSDFLDVPSRSVTSLNRLREGSGAIR